MDQTEAKKILRRVFTSLTEEQKAHARTHLAAGVEVLAGSLGFSCYATATGL